MTGAIRTSRVLRFALPGLVLVLAVLLGLRVYFEWRSHRPEKARVEAIVPSIAPAHAPAARVPQPKPLTLADIPAPPRWNQMSYVSEKLPITKLAFSIDLDYFAPLGDGAANAAVWFRDFARNDGSRVAEIKNSDLRTVKFLGTEDKVFPADHPLLREAEPWVDQATCRFYPVVWKPVSLDTPIPNLLFTMRLAKSWSARGAAEADAERAKDDFRRAIRLGRLFMQDDLSVIQQLIGWACVAMGLRGLNQAAHDEGDTVMVAATNLALGDYNAMRGCASAWLTQITFDDPFRKTWLGWRWAVPITDRRLDDLIAHARGNPLRCWRGEALQSLAAVAHEGSRRQRERAAAVLNELAHDKDPLLAAQAEWLVTHYRDLRSDLIRESR